MLVRFRTGWVATLTTRIGAKQKATLSDRTDTKHLSLLGIEFVAESEVISVLLRLSEMNFQWIIEFRGYANAHSLLAAHSARSQIAIIRKNPGSKLCSLR